MIDNISEEYVVLVDVQDREQGLMEKIQAHKDGLLHRAISVFIFNSKNELLLQQRAAGKYHSAGLWTNTCCSHPRQGEQAEAAAKRRLYEEMGIVTPLRPVFNFVYKAELENGLMEHEYDHVFMGITNELPVPDTGEVADWKYMSSESLEKDINAAPEAYTAWFRICFKEYYSQLFGDKQAEEK